MKTAVARTLSRADYDSEKRRLCRTYGEVKSYKEWKAARDAVAGVLSHFGPENKGGGYDGPGLFNVQDDWSGWKCVAVSLRVERMFQAETFLSVRELLRLRFPDFFVTVICDSLDNPVRFEFLVSSSGTYLTYRSKSREEYLAIAEYDSGIIAWLQLIDSLTGTA